MLFLSAVDKCFLRVLPHVCDDPAGADAVEDSISLCGAAVGKSTPFNIGVEPISGGEVVVGGAGVTDGSGAPRPVQLRLRLAERPPLIPALSI